jgi:hypothetical protein
LSSEYEIELAEPAERVYRKLYQQAPACAGTCSQMKTPGLTLNIFAQNLFVEIHAGDDAVLVSADVENQPARNVVGMGILVKLRLACAGEEGAGCR